MDPSHDLTLLTITFPSEGIRTPRQMALNPSVLHGAGNSVFSPVSGFIALSIKKGPLIAGFLLFSSHFPEIGPFLDVARILPIQGDPGPSNRVERVNSGLKQGQKRPNTVHLRPKGLSQTYPTGTWIYPTLSLEPP